MKLFALILLTLIPHQLPLTPPPGQPPPPLPPETWINVEIDTPKQGFICCYPRIIRVPTLLPEKEKLTSIKAPAGTRNVALGRPVSSSDPLPIIGDLAMITNGDKDYDDGCWTELGPHRQWIQIDLGDSHELYGIAAWRYYKCPRAYLDVIVQISDDPEFRAGLTTTVYNNDLDNSSGLGKGRDRSWLETKLGHVIQLGGQRARYVRLCSNGNSSNGLNHYIEVEVLARQPGS